MNWTYRPDHYYGYEYTGIIWLISEHYKYVRLSYQASLIMATITRHRTRVAGESKLGIYFPVSV